MSMGKKTIIITQKQLDEICNGNSAYLDSLALKPDMGNIYAGEITADGSIDNGYPIPTTTDDHSHEMTNDWRGNAKLAGAGPVVVHEMTKKEWAEMFVLNEEGEHGNERLKHKTFGAQNGENGKSYDATKMAISRLGQAQEEMKTGATQDIKNKAARRVARMQKNWNGIGLAAQQYNTAKNIDKSLRQSQNGPKMKSAPKVSGNGQAHTPKNGIITN